MRRDWLHFWSASGGRSLLAVASFSSDVNGFGNSGIVRARLQPCRKQTNQPALAAEVRGAAHAPISRASLMIAVALLISAFALAVPLASQQQPREFLSLPTPTPATGFVISESGTVAAAPCRDGVLRVWSLPDGKLTQAINIKDRAVDVTAISDDGKFVAVGDHRGEVTVWNTTTAVELNATHLPHYPVGAAFSHNGALVAFAPAAGVPVIVLDTPRHLGGRPVPDTADAVAIAFSRDNNFFAAANGDTSMRVYDLKAGKTSSIPTELLNEALTIDFTADGKQIIAAGGDKVVYFIDSATGKTVRKFPKLPDPIFAISVSPDGTLLCTVTLHAEGMSLPAPIIIWDIASGAKKQEWTPPAGALGGGWTADGHLVIATATKDAIHLFRMN